jgi:hypothetical protein
MQGLNRYKVMVHEGLMIALVLYLLTAYPVNGQTATAKINHQTADPETTVVVPILVNGFDDVGAITLFFSYDNDVLSYNTFQNAAVPGFDVNAFINTQGVPVVGMSWSAASGTTIPDGTLIEIVFDYHSGISALDFDEVYCSIAIIAGGQIEDLDVEYTNGSISPVTGLSERKGLPESESPKATIYYNQQRVYLYNPTDDEVAVKIFDHSGRLISQYCAKGQGLHEWDFVKKAGTYLYRMISRDNIISGKLNEVIY